MRDVRNQTGWVIDRRVRVEARSQMPLRLRPHQGDPDQAKALLRILIAELRVNSRNEILPTYRCRRTRGLRTDKFSGRWRAKTKTVERG
jgi:hypothetical protein